ncbi:E3 ubiquitin-protein ligase UPL3 [Striga asiatica]|uniref:E3 ubiquitin-protein ligase UPL3 n=1 Tax=Striga asiatica TaxID=4170 RepID=A0A5A7PGJ3_STRAF|nr:E3 ubiquitin-protein ligase UPL3 [Striga asiatica]
MVDALWNPTIDEVRSLPRSTASMPLIWTNAFIYYVLGFDPSSKDYKVIRILSNSAAEFYTLLSHELQKDGLGMWRSGSSSGGLSMEVDRDGLFDIQLPNADASDGSKFCKVIEYYRLFGRVMAKALQDGRFLDLPLSVAFYNLAFGQDDELDISPVEIDEALVIEDDDISDEDDDDLIPMHMMEHLLPTVEECAVCEMESQIQVSIVADLAQPKNPDRGHVDMGHAVNVLVEKWRPLDDETEQYCGVDYSLPLDQMVKDWQEAEGKNIGYATYTTLVVPINSLLCLTPVTRGGAHAEDPAPAGEVRGSGRERVQLGLILVNGLCRLTGGDIEQIGDEKGAFGGEEHHQHVVELAWGIRLWRGGVRLRERPRAAGPDLGERGTG